MSDVEKLLAKLGSLGVDENTIAMARKDLSEHANHVMNWLQLAAHLRRIRFFDASLETYETAAHRFPKSPRLWNNRGILLREYGHLDKAITSFEKALDLKPDYVHAIESMAITYEKLQKFNTASDLYKKVLTLDEKRPLCWNNLGNCLRMQGLEEEAIDSYQQALNFDPQHIDAMFNLASLQYERKRYSEALNTIDKCALLKPSDKSIQALRKEILSRPSELHRAIPAPLHNSGYLFRLGTNVDEHKKVIQPDFSKGKILSGEDVLLMGREEAARVVGTQIWDRIHLQRLVHEAIFINEPPPLGFSVPFISYRWGDVAHTKWVIGFVRDLEQRGYDVVFDRNAEREERPPSAPDLIARMAKCNLFVPIFTDRYTRRVLVSPDTSSPSDDGWVFDEWEIAKNLGNMQRLGFMGIWASGDDLPPPFTRDNVCDFRDPERYNEEMDKIFPVRYVTVIGIRSDKTFRALTRLRRCESKDAVARFQALKEFEHIAIVEDPADRDSSTGG